MLENLFSQHNRITIPELKKYYITQILLLIAHHITDITLQRG